MSKDSPLGERKETVISIIYIEYEIHFLIRSVLNQTVMSFEALPRRIIDKRYFTMKSLILAQDER